MVKGRALSNSCTTTAKPKVLERVTWGSSTLGPSEGMGSSILSTVVLNFKDLGRKTAENDNL